MFDGAVGRDYDLYQKRMERAAIRSDWWKPILAVNYDRYEGGEIQAVCPACEGITRVSIYPCRLVETLKYIGKSSWICVRCQDMRAEIQRAEDIRDGYILPEPAEFEDDIPF